MTASKKSLGWGYLKYFHVAENAKYISEAYLQEVLASLAFAIWKKNYKEINKSQLFWFIQREDRGNYLTRN